MIKIEIPWEPTPWAAPRLGVYNIYDPKSAEKKAVRAFLHSIYTDDPIVDYTVLEFIFTFKYPTSASKQKLAEMRAGKIIPTKCDCTNLQKLYEDCLKKIVIDDDRKVACIKSKKLYSNQDRTIIQIYTLQEYLDEDSSRRD